MELSSYRVAVLGESGVGKSSLVQRYVFNVFTETGPQTGKEEETKTIIFKTGQHVELKICDTQGQERADLLTDTFYKDVDAIIFVYDITNSRSLWNSDVWIRDWTIHIPNLQTMPVLLVGTKTDVLQPQQVHNYNDERPSNEDPDRDEEEVIEIGSGFVDPGVVRELVKQHPFIRSSLKCSARTGVGVAKVFQTIAAELASVKQTQTRTCVCL